MFPLRSLFNVLCDMQPENVAPHVRLLTKFHQSIGDFSRCYDDFLKMQLGDKPFSTSVFVPFDIAMSADDWELLVNDWLHAEKERDFEGFVKIMGAVIDVEEQGHLIFDPDFRFTIGELEPHRIDYYDYVQNLGRLRTLQDRLGDDLSAVPYLYPLMNSDNGSELTLGLMIYTASGKPILTALRDQSAALSASPRAE